MALGMEVTAVDSLSTGRRQHVPTGCRWLEGHLGDPGFVQKLWSEDSYDYIYHLAWRGGRFDSQVQRSLQYQTNLAATTELIQEAALRKTECFVFASSIAVYGLAPTGMTEYLPPLPNTPYGIAKYAAELDLRAAHNSQGLHSVIFRLHHVYGERQNLQETASWNAVSALMKQALQGETMTVFGDGEQTRAFTFVGDVAPLIAVSPLEPRAVNQVFNAGSDDPTTINQLAMEISQAFRKRCKIKHLPARDEPLHAFPNHEKFHSVFPTRTITPLSEGIHRTARWIQSAEISA